MAVDNTKHNPDLSSWDKKAKKHQTTPMSEFITTVALYLCRKIMFTHINIILFLYVTSLVVFPLLGDFPKTYLSRSDNLIKEHFVKVGWCWTLMFIFPHTLLTSYVYCCGRWRLVLRHLSRLCLATASWYICISLIEEVEAKVGVCLLARWKHVTKWACLEHGFYWQGFDISGDTFTLIYSSLVLFEETRVLIGWEGINDLIKEETHARSNTEDMVKSRPMKNLSTEEFSRLKISFLKLLPFVKWLFLAITCLTMFWTAMLICELLYFHIMIEVLVGGALAILTWYFTYRWVYPLPGSVPRIPGDGLFKYQDIFK